MGEPKLKLDKNNVFADNPRTITEREMELLSEHLSEFGDLGGIVYCVKNKAFVGGNQRSEIMDGAEIEIVERFEKPTKNKTLALGFIHFGGEKFSYREVAFTKAEFKKACIVANSDGGAFDWDILGGAAWKDLPLSDWGLEMPTFETVEETETQDAEPQIDKAAELNKVWQVRAGDLWAIGEHRLLCGDSTKREDVERLMDGAKAELCLTDPPYGLNEKKQSGKNDYESYVDSKENLIKLANGWLPIAREICSSVVFSCGVTNAWVYPPADWLMCWFYGGGQLRSSWGFNCWQPFLCYGKDPSLATGNGGRPDAVDMNTPSNSGDIDHPCPKPLKLWQWFIQRMSFNNGQIFYEPFAGSGTTLVACQNLNRKCYAIEISPEYCSVVLQRMTDAFPDIEIKKVTRD